MMIKRISIFLSVSATNVTAMLTSPPSILPSSEGYTSASAWYEAYSKGQIQIPQPDQKIQYFQTETPSTSVGDSESDSRNISPLSTMSSGLHVAQTQTVLPYHTLMTNSVLNGGLGQTQTVLPYHSVFDQTQNHAVLPYHTNASGISRARSTPPSPPVTDTNQLNQLRSKSVSPSPVSVTPHPDSLKRYLTLRELEKYNNMQETADNVVVAPGPSVSLTPQKAEIQNTDVTQKANSTVEPIKRSKSTTVTMHYTAKQYQDYNSMQETINNVVVAPGPGPSVPQKANTTVSIEPVLHQANTLAAHRANTLAQSLTATDDSIPIPQSAQITRGRSVTRNDNPSRLIATPRNTSYATVNKGITTSNFIHRLSSIPEVVPESQPQAQKIDLNKTVTNINPGPITNVTSTAASVYNSVIKSNSLPAHRIQSAPALSYYVDDNSRLLAQSYSTVTSGQVQRLRASFTLPPKHAKILEGKDKRATANSIRFQDNVSVINLADGTQSLKPLASLTNSMSVQRGRSNLTTVNSTNPTNIRESAPVRVSSSTVALSKSLTKGNEGTTVRYTRSREPRVGHDHSSVTDQIQKALSRGPEPASHYGSVGGDFKVQDKDSVETVIAGSVTPSVPKNITFLNPDTSAAPSTSIIGTTVVVPKVDNNIIPNCTTTGTVPCIELNAVPTAPRTELNAASTVNSYKSIMNLSQTQPQDTVSVPVIPTSSTTTGPINLLNYPTLNEVTHATTTVSILGGKTPLFQKDMNAKSTTSIIGTQEVVPMAMSKTVTNTLDPTPTATTMYVSQSVPPAPSTTHVSAIPSLALSTTTKVPAVPATSTSQPVNLSTTTTTVPQLDYNHSTMNPITGSSSYPSYNNHWGQLQGNGTTIIDKNQIK